MAHDWREDEPAAEYDYETIERWTSIPKFENFYEVSSFGRIRSVRRKTKSGITKTGWKWSGGKVLKQDTTKNGYKRVELCKYGKRSKMSVHRAVASAWIPNTFRKPCVNHIDNDPSNNHVLNLDWCTHKENMQHAEKQGRVKHHQGETHNFVKLTNIQVLEARRLRSKGVMIKDIAKKFGVEPSTMGSAVNGKTWRHI